MSYLQEFGYKVIPVNPFSTGKKINGETFVEKLEDREGNVKVSHEKAIKMKSWEKLQKLYDNKD